MSEWPFEEMGLVSNADRDKWQPIKTAPKNKLLLVWIEGFHAHSGVSWRRCGYLLSAIHDGALPKNRRRAAKDMLIGVETLGEDWDLWPTKWQPLPAPPEEQT